MNEGEEKSEWQRTLESMPPKEGGRREPNEPAASIAVQEFLREVHFRFETAASAFRNGGLEVTLEPSLPEGITAESSIVLLVARPGVAGSSHSLHCERNQGLDMYLFLDRGLPWNDTCSFAVDREPESPLIFVEDSLERLKAKTEGSIR